MDFTHTNIVNATLNTIWQYTIWTCALSAAFLSVGFILAVIGSALWQTVTDARRIIRRHILSFSYFSHETRRGIRVLAFLLLACGSLAAASFAQSSRAASASSYLDRGAAIGEFHSVVEDYSLGIVFAPTSASAILEKQIK